MTAHTPTPRTDALASHHYSHVHPWSRCQARLNGMTEFARQLERSHDELLAVVQDLVTYGGGMEYDDYRMLVQRAEAAIAKAQP